MIHIDRSGQFCAGHNVDQTCIVSVYAVTRYQHNITLKLREVVIAFATFYSHVISGTVATFRVLSAAIPCLWLAVTYDIVSAQHVLLCINLNGFAVVQ